MIRQLSSKYSLSAIQNPADLKCCRCTACDQLLDLDQKGIKTCEKCDSLTCPSCYDRKKEAKDQCVDCSQNGLVEMSQFQKKAYQAIAVQCACGDQFALKDLPSHSSKCSYIKCPLCNGNLDSACRPHIAKLNEDYIQLQAHAANLEQYLKQIETTINENALQPYFIQYTTL